MPNLGQLTLLPLLCGAATEDGRIVVTQKFLDGMERHARHWPGPVKAILEPCEAATHNLDNVAVDPDELPFGLELMPYDAPRLTAEIARSELVLGGPDHRLPQLGALCRAYEVPCVFNTEYTLRTRLQIARIEEPHPLKLLKRSLWEANQERLTVQSLLGVAAVQCNGAPTYRQYRRFASDAFLYFDSRTDLTLFASEDELTARARRLAAGGPLTLAFSGRLHGMKGADHLADIARGLKRRNVPFRLLVAGDGPCAAGLRERIERERLDEVELLGVLDFRTELMPLMRREVDLFVAPHRQGDPSCTYLETFAAGVPVVGYDNEAFAGLLEIAPSVGFRAPLGRPDALARCIAELDRRTLIEASHACLRFARQHEFESTFARRVEHLIDVALRERAKVRARNAPPVRPSELAHRELHEV